MSDRRTRLTAAVRHVGYTVLWPFMFAYIASFAFATRAAYMDDAYIGFQFVRNLLNGNGFVFAVGQPPVEGVTNIGWLLFLAPLALLVAPPIAAKALGLALVVVVLLLTYRLARRLGHRSDEPLLALLPTLIVATNVHFLYFSLAGMESALLAALLLAMALLAVRAPASLALPALGALAFTVHPEAILVFPLYTLLMARAPALARREQLRGGGLFLALLVAFTLARYAAFHALLPNTFAAKPSSDARIIYNLYSALIGSNVNVPFPVSTLFALLLLLLGARALRALAAPAAAMTASIALTGVLFGIYAAPDWTALGRYFAPYLPAAVLMIWYGATTALVAQPAPERPVRSLYGAPALALAVALVGASVFSSIEQTRQETLARYPGYVLASTTLVAPARWIDAHLPPNATIATRRIGALSYYARQRVFDYAFGLTEPDVARLIAARGRAFDDPNDPALAERWHAVQPDGLLEDERVMTEIIQHARGTEERFVVHGIGYRVAQRFPIGDDVRWVLALRSGQPLVQP